MPVNIPASLPAVEALRKESVFVMTEARASTQDIRPLEIGIVNLMPTKISTETQLLRLLSSTPLQVEITLVHMGNHIPKNTAREHMDAFYKTFHGIQSMHFDGLIITGAPVETLAFHEVDYWSELCTVMEWSKSHVFSTMHICWGAQAGLYYHYGIDKHNLPAKLFGVFEHQVLYPQNRLTRGFDSRFFAPHSRYTTVREQDLLAAKLSVLSTSTDAGVYIAASADRRQIFVTGHPEYDALTLHSEYCRDIDKGIATSMPLHYYQDDNINNPPEMRWRAHAYMLFANWLNYYVYQRTPYNISAISR